MSSSRNAASGKSGNKYGSAHLQLKRLQDGLSEYFSATGDRSRRGRRFPPTFDIYSTASRARKRTDPTQHKAVKKIAASRDDVPAKSEKKSVEKQQDKRKKAGTINEKMESRPRTRRSLGQLEMPSPPESGETPLFKIPDTISKWDENLFREARELAHKQIPTVADDYEGSLPPRIQLGDKKIKTWYTSPFPEEYIRCQCLYMCEFCLQYMKTLDVLKNHYEKCPWHRPPGVEIYRDTVVVSTNGSDAQQELVVYETDGNEWKYYCQKICLLAKLYLDHKILYYDVETFLFYVLCRRDKYGDHLIGYFSKEKDSPQQNNVSCLMVLPPFQGDGYGRFLIDFSYLLSRVEEEHGTPEKPLSELGELSYHAYWRSAVLDFFLEQRSKSSAKTSIKAICDTTGMQPQDVVDALHELNFLVKNEETEAWEFSMIREVLDDYEKKKLNGKKKIPLFREKLQWNSEKEDESELTTEDSDTSGSRTGQQAQIGDDQEDGGQFTGSLKRSPRKSEAGRK